MQIPTRGHLWRSIPEWETAAVLVMLLMAVGTGVAIGAGFWAMPRTHVATASTSPGGASRVVHGCTIAPHRNCTGTNLASDNLAGVDMSGSVLVGADLSGANLTDADLSWVTLGRFGQGANLAGADLTNVDLYGADLTAVNLTGATTSGADILGVRWCDTTMPDGTINNSDCGP